MIHTIEVQGQKIKAKDAFNNTIAITVDNIANVETVVSKIDWILNKSAMPSLEGISVIHLGNLNHVNLVEIY
jgi:hypothetical protein